MTTVRILRNVSVHDAVCMLLRDNTPDITEYTSILDSILQTGYSINSNESELLMSALTYERIQEVKLLLARGASVASNQRVYNHKVFTHAFWCGRVYPQEIADALLEHILTSPHFEVIIALLSQTDYNNRINVFNNASDDTLRAKLYIRLGKLPKGLQNANITNAFTKAMNEAAQKPAESEKLLSETEKRLEETEKRLAETEQLLATETEKYCQAVAMIKKLTAL